MSIKQIEDKLIILGNGLLNQKKYDFDFKYEKSDFFNLRFTKQRLDQVKLHNNIYKRL